MPNSPDGTPEDATKEILAFLTGPHGRQIQKCLPVPAAWEFSWGNYKPENEPMCACGKRMGEGTGGGGANRFVK